MQSKASAALVFFFPATPTVRRTCLARTSLYTDVVLFFISFFSKTSASENERGAPEDFLLHPTPPSTTTHLRWRIINPIPCGLYFITRARRTSRENRRSVNRLGSYGRAFFKKSFQQQLYFVLHSEIGAHKTEFSVM